MLVFDQHGQNGRVDKFKFTDLRALCQDMGLNKNSGDGPLTVRWLLRVLEMAHFNQDENTWLPWQMIEEGINRQREVDI